MFFNSNYMYFCHFKFYLQKHSWFISKISKIPSEFLLKLQQCGLHWSKESRLSLNSTCMLAWDPEQPTQQVFHGLGRACLFAVSSQFYCWNKIKTQCLESWKTPELFYNGPLFTRVCASAVQPSHILIVVVGKIPNVPGNIMDAPPPWPQSSEIQIRNLQT